MGLQSRGSSKFENFKTFNLGVSGQNDIWVLAIGLGTKKTIRGKVIMSQPYFEGSVRMKLTLSKVGLRSLLGLPKLQSLIAGV